MDKLVTPPKRVTSPMWVLPAPWEQALRFFPCKVNQAPESENFCLWNLESVLLSISIHSFDFNCLI